MKASFSWLAIFISFAVSVTACQKNSPVIDGAEETEDGTETTGTTGTSGAPTGGDAFLYGSNMTWVEGWNDDQIAEILIGNPAKNIAGAGVNSLRPAMYDHFVEQWGYNIRVDAFNIYQQLGAKNNVIFLNGPSDAHRDRTRYCDNHESETFANLYEPIWQGNGSINENNYYARYVYNVVKTYSPFVKYWEVWNEPDYTWNWQASQTWDTQDPNPCDLNGFYAPVQHYVRMLRITYEVVKAIDKSAYVCLGGIGYTGFLDAVLRNTDNPNGGGVTGDYPKKGGDWFDYVSFHLYPMYWGVKNSDEAANTLAIQKTDYEKVLNKYQLGGKKDFIVTECNIPRKSLNGQIGSDEAQRNFLIKAAVISQKSNIKGLYVYGPNDNATLEQATDPYHIMGFYQPITGAPYNATPNSSATAWRTVSTLLKNRLYDANATAALQLPGNVEGGAFYSAAENNHVYVLWAKPTGDTEDANTTYNFPASLGISSATTYSWNQQEGQTGSSLQLTGSPLFVKK